MKSAFIIFLFFCSGSFPARATTTIHDPNQVLVALRNYLGATSLAQEFTCGDSAFIKGFVISCDAYQADTDWASDSCKSVADPNGIMVTRSVTNCSDTQVSLLLDKTGDMTTVTSDDFQAAHGNYAELFLNNLVDFTGYAGAELTLQSISKVQYVFARNSANPRTVDAMTIQGVLGEPGKKGFAIVVTVVKDVIGVAQIVRFRMDDQTWFLVDDFAGVKK